MKAAALLLAATMSVATLASAEAGPLGEFIYQSPSIMPAAHLGNARAQARLGFMYQAGRGVPQNYGLAAYWYRRGAEQGDPRAQRLLGLLYDKGQGVPTDHVLAHMWLNLAASRSKGAEYEDNVRLRNALATKMSLGQLADAQYLAAAWVPKPER